MFTTLLCNDNSEIILQIFNNTSTNQAHVPALPQKLKASNETINNIVELHFKY